MSKKNPRKRKKPKLECKVIEYRDRTYNVTMYPDESGTCTVKDRRSVDTITIGHLYRDHDGTGYFDESFLNEIRYQ